MSKKYILTGIVPGNPGKFEIAGDFTTVFKTAPTSTSFDVSGSTYFDGRFYVASSVYNSVSNKTEITVLNELQNHPFIAGEISNASVYRLTTPEEDEVIIIDEKEFDVTTSLEFIGKSAEGWGETLQQNILSMLSHFSSPSAPISPIKGQLWFDESTKLLKIWVGTWQTVNQAPSSPNHIGSYTFTQAVPTMTWNVIHNLNSTNLVFNVLVDVAGNLQSIIPATVQYTSADELTITFSTPYAGKVAIIRAAN